MTEAEFDQAIRWTERKDECGDILRTATICLKAQAKISSIIMNGPKLEMIRKDCDQLLKLELLHKLYTDRRNEAWEALDQFLEVSQPVWTPGGKSYFVRRERLIQAVGFTAPDFAQKD